MNGRAASSLAPNHQMAKLSPPYRRAVFDRLQRLPLRNTGRRPLDLCELRHGLRELGTNLLSFCRTAELAIASSYLSNFPSLLPACRRGGVQMSVRPAQAATMTVALLGISWPATVENQGDNGSMRRVSRHHGVILPRQCPVSSVHCRIRFTFPSTSMYLSYWPPIRQSHRPCGTLATTVCVPRRMPPQVGTYRTSFRGFYLQHASGYPG